MSQARPDRPNLPAHAPSGPSTPGQPTGWSRPAMPPVPGGAGRYRLLEAVGRGATATVHRAWDAQLGRAVAVKALGAIDDPAKRERFRREVHTSARLRHPHIVSVHDAIDLDGQLCLVMDFVEGDSLDRLSRPERRLPRKDAIRHVRDVARAIAYAHEQGVLHRDVKPGNILIDRHGHAWVVDFGFARVLFDATGGDVAVMTRPGAVVGTPRYMSPEQASGEPIDERSDVYGIGATLYRALTGRPPYAGEEASFAVFLRDPPPPSALDRAIPEALDRIVMRAMAREVADRYPSASALADALDGVLERESSGRLAPRRARSTRRGPAGGSSRAPIVAAVAIVGTLAAVGGFFALAARREETDARARLDSTAPGAPVAPTTEPEPAAASDPVADLLALASEQEVTLKGAARARQHLLEARRLAAGDPDAEARVDEASRVRAGALLARARETAHRAGPFDETVTGLLDEAAAIAAAADRALQAKVQLEKADFLFRRGRWRRVIAAAEEITHPGEEQLQGRYLRAKALSKLGRGAAATNALEVLAREHEAHRVGLDARAALLSDDWDYDAVIPLCERILAAHAADRQAMQTLAVALAFRGRPAEAAEVARRALALAPDSSRAHMALGFATMLTAPREAVAAFTRSLELGEDPPDPSVLKWRGITLMMKLGDLGAARADLDRLVELHPESADALIWRSVACWHQGDRERAAAGWRKAHALDPERFRRRLGDLPPQLREEIIRIVSEPDAGAPR